MLESEKSFGGNKSAKISPDTESSSSSGIQDEPSRSERAAEKNTVNTKNVAGQESVEHNIHKYQKEIGYSAAQLATEKNQQSSSPSFQKEVNGSVSITCSQNIDRHSKSRPSSTKNNIDYAAVLKEVRKETKRLILNLEKDESIDSSPQLLPQTPDIEISPETDEEAEHGSHASSTCSSNGPDSLPPSLPESPTSSPSYLKRNPILQGNAESITLSQNLSSFHEGGGAQFSQYSPGNRTPREHALGVFTVDISKCVYVMQNFLSATVMLLPITTRCGIHCP